jgi:enamidase
MKIFKRALCTMITATCAAWLPAQAADIIITNATVFDGSGRAPIKNASVLIGKGRIERVQQGKVKETAPVMIDARGKTVMPGLINSHFHLFFDFYSGKASNPVGSDAEAAAYIQEKMPTRLKGHLEQGITSLFTPIDFWPHIYELRRQVASGQITGPRIFAGGPILMHSGPHYACASEPGNAKAWCDERIALADNTPEQARQAIAQLVKDGADVAVYDAITNQPTFDAATFKVLVDEAHRKGLRIVAHNSDAKDATTMVRDGVDGFIHPPTVTRDTDGKLLSIVGQHHLPLAITLGFFQRYMAEGKASPKDIQDYETLLTNVKVMLKAGATPLFASDMPGLPPQEVVPTITRVMSGVGVDNKNILLAATRNAARNFLGKKDLGTLEPGQIADVILVDGNPLLDLSALAKVQVVIKDGHVVVDKRASKSS